MRFTSVYTVLLAQAFTALCQNDYPYQAPLSCEERASLQGLPTDGWNIVYYDGQPTCRRVSVGEFAFCDGTEYTDASGGEQDTKVKGCCSGASELIWMNEQDKLAKLWNSAAPKITDGLMMEASVPLARLDHACKMAVHQSLYGEKQELLVGAGLAMQA
ncbi:hypothetical protein K503DRAFT_780565 [Rhizopogon vinicolor AM-OR11-026]|uniref:Uncharacterized protein n=1 Tax=Rhizopogon vinicolor AM-OR11-026 TaxID=1314800 RepID=A0A1B7N9M0_9AGAM|nr:hypothetical protein K503DRAFT_780565 [Rhizopogon vinicolor AM-OR11-026]